MPGGPLIVQLGTGPSVPPLTQSLICALIVRLPRFHPLSADPQVLHRDLKLENILLQGGGMCTLLGSHFAARYACTMQWKECTLVCVLGSHFNQSTTVHRVSSIVTKTSITSTPSTLPAGTDPATSSTKIADFGLSALVARAQQDLAEEEAAAAAAATAASTLRLGPLTQVTDRRKTGRTR